MLPTAHNLAPNLLGLFRLLDVSPTATVSVTPTVTVEATPIPVIPTPVPTSIPLPSAWSPGQWFHNSSGWSNSFHAPFLILFILIAVAACVVYFIFAQRRLKNHTLHAHLAERVSVGLTVIAIVGLLLVFFGFAKTTLLSFPIWLIVSMVAMIALAIYCIYYYVTVYPVALSKYEREHERARYLPRAKTKGPAQTPPMKKKQQQKQKRK